MAASGSGGRQPGSTFKPVTLAANLEAGNGAAQRFPAPAEISLDVGADEPWDVSNAGDRGYGTLTLAEATVNSVNTVYAQAVMRSEEHTSEHQSLMRTSNAVFCLKNKNTK